MFQSHTREWLVFRLDAHFVAVPLTDVSRVLPMMALDARSRLPGFVQGVMNLAGEGLPVIDLRRRLGWRTKPPHVEDHIILLEADGHRFGLAVGGIVGVQSVDAPAGTLGTLVADQVRRISGTATTENGELLLLCTPSTLISKAEYGKVASAVAGADHG